ncbi:MAG: hypothetical protein RBS57_19770 [Desulforhabdus sp.]|nr:hypothetical protein [Desulforhabdus sp.]
MKVLGIILLVIMIGTSLGGCACLQQGEKVAMLETAPPARAEVVETVPQPPPEPVRPPKMDRN